MNQYENIFYKQKNICLSVAKDKPQILLVDDDPLLCRAVKRLLEGNGMLVTCVQSGKAALLCLHETYSLVLLDLALGTMDGFDVLARIRERDTELPVIMLSGNREDLTKVRALGLGADNYVEKPFIPHIMLSQVKAMLRFAQREKQAPLAPSLFRYDEQEDRIYKGADPLTLTGKEKALLRYLMAHPRKVVSFDEIDAHVWHHAAVNDDAIARIVANLRKKIEDNPTTPACLQTLKGAGYRFVPDGDS